MTNPFTDRSYGVALLEGWAIVLNSITDKYKRIWRMKILVVDDMTSMRHIMIHMLQSIGYEENDEAVNGRQALQLIRKNKYDLLITDYHMPKINGIQLLKLIRSDKELFNLPVLMVTCEDQKNEIESIIAAKVNGFIIKPFNTNTLKKQINWIKHESNELISININ
jgi:two-component system chemotaxis response regulator CheY